MCGFALFLRPERRFFTVSVFGLAILLALTILAFSSSVQAEELASLPRNPTAPTDAGAPFLPSIGHTNSVTERADLLVQVDRLDTAQRSLGSRGNAPETSRILESQQAAVRRDLETIPTTELSNPTAAFGIDVGVFPVDELRKPFRNDWDEPRSGGRRHRGTDLLAQHGVPLRAIEDGSFERSTVGSLGGLSVYLLGDSGARYYYAHLAHVETFVEGQRVYAGQIIGSVGDSGNAAGSPHLHLQWAPDGESDWRNPFPLLDALYGEGSFTSPRSLGPPNAQA